MRVAGQSMQRRPETVAAIVNGLVVLSVPPALLLFGSCVDWDSDTSMTVRPENAPWLLPLLQMVMQVSLVLAPFAVFAGWRTWVHATRWRDRGERGWQGVWEAGATGFILTLLYLSPGIVTKPIQAPPYIIVYGGATLILGLLIGLVLRVIALVVLDAVEAPPP